MRHLTPASPTAPETQSFCQQIVHDVSPILVKSQPQPGAVEKDCFINVDNYIKCHGGRAVLGWAIWLVPGVYIEAEFHCIWQGPDDVMLDVTPHPYHFESTSFLQDSTCVYTGLQVDSIRKSLVSDRDVIRWLHLAKRRFEIVNTGSLAAQYGNIELPPKLAKEYFKNEEETRKLNIRLSRRYP